MYVTGTFVIKLNNKNYQLWKHKMKLLLKAKKVWYTIETLKPELNDANLRDVQAYEEECIGSFNHIGIIGIR